MMNSVLNAIKRPTLTLAWSATLACAFLRFMPNADLGTAPSIHLVSVRAQITDGDFATPEQESVFERKMGVNSLEMAPVSLRERLLSSGDLAGKEFLMGFPMRLIASQDQISRAKPFGWPALGSPTSGFGQRISPFCGEPRFHSGIDIANEEGTAVRSTADGTVESAEWRNGYGSVILIDHGAGYQTVYGHNSLLLVQPGQKVSRGQTIAFMGNSGLSTGAHTHYEVWRNGHCVDPTPYLFPKPVLIRQPIALHPSAERAYPLPSKKPSPYNFEQFLSKNPNAIGVPFSGFGPTHASDLD